MVNGQVVETDTPKQTITFYEHPVLDMEASEEAGTRKYKVMPYIKIETKGNTCLLYTSDAADE